MKRCDISLPPCPCGIPWTEHDSPQKLREHNDWHREQVRRELTAEPKRWFGWPKR